MRTSPCIGQCYDIDEERELCLGCYRTIDEIADWDGKSPEEIRKILVDIKHRRKGGNPAG